MALPNGQALLSRRWQVGGATAPSRQGLLDRLEGHDHVLDVVAPGGHGQALHSLAEILVRAKEPCAGRAVQQHQHPGRPCAGMAHLPIGPGSVDRPPHTRDFELRVVREGAVELKKRKLPGQRRLEGGLGLGLAFGRHSEFGDPVLGGVKDQFRVGKFGRNAHGRII